MSNPNQVADHFLCRVIRGDRPPWPAEEGDAFQQAFIERSRYHGVQPLVFDRMQSAEGWDDWPRAVREDLINALRAGAAVDMMRAHKVSDFLERLTRRGIPFLVVKGAALAHSHYPNSALRTRCDTDLFISYRDISAFCDTLREAGFEVIPPIYKSHQFSGALRHGGNALAVLDVHWRILNAARFARVIDFDEALANAVPVPGKEGWQTLNAVDSLLLACMHRRGSDNHDPDSLLWIYDIHLLISAMSEEESAGFASKAVQRGVQPDCLDGVLKARSCFHTELPEGMLATLETPRPEPGLSQRYRDSNLGLLVDDFMNLPGAGARLNLLKELFFPPASSLMNRYGREGRAWLPVLYCRFLLDRLWRRLSLN